MAVDVSAKWIFKRSTLLQSSCSAVSGGIAKTSAAPFKSEFDPDESGCNKDRGDFTSGSHPVCVMTAAILRWAHWSAHVYAAGIEARRAHPGLEVDGGSPDEVLIL